jgi:hypothetical protein
MPFASDLSVSMALRSVRLDEATFADVLGGRVHDGERDLDGERDEEADDDDSKGVASLSPETRAAPRLALNVLSSSRDEE